MDTETTETFHLAPKVQQSREKESDNGTYTTRYGVTTCCMNTSLEGAVKNMTRWKVVSKKFI